MEPKQDTASPEAEVSGAAAPTTAPPQQEAAAFSLDAFLSTYLPALILALGAGIALPAIPTLAKSFNVTFGVASSVATAFLIGNTAGSIPTGWLLDRFGRRRVMIAGPLLTAAASFMVLTAHSFPELVFYRFVAGWATQMWVMGRLSAISEYGRVNQRGRQVSWMFGMDGIGLLAGPLPGGLIAAAWGLRAPFVAYGFVALLALVPVYKYIQDSPRRAASGGGLARSPSRMSLRELVLPRLPFFGVAFFASVARGPIFGGLLYLYAAFAYGLNPQSIALLATASSAISLPISFLSGYLMDRLGRKKTMVPGFTGVTIAMLGLAVSAVLHLSLAWYVGVFLFTMVSQSITGGSIQTVGTDVAPPEARGMFLGVWNFVGRFGTSASPIVFALLADRAGYPSSFAFVAGAAATVAFLLIRYVSETARVESSSEPDRQASGISPVRHEGR